MTRIWAVAVVAVVLGCGAGLGLTWLNHGGVVNHFALQPASLAGTEGGDLAAPKLVVVGGDTHDFGTRQFNQEATHVFVIQNVGEKPLKLEFNAVSCGRCIQTDFTGDIVQPGNKTNVEVTYVTSKSLPQFRERLELSTNDMTRPVVDLRIEGFVTHAIRASIDELTVGAISGNEDNATQFRLYGYRSDQLEVVDFEFVQPATADLFEVVVRSLAKEEFEDEPKAMSALEVNVTIKSGLPLGPISQTIRFQAKADIETEIEIPLQGKVVSDITLLGGGFNADNSSVNFGSVSAHEGSRRSLRVLVKGPYRDDIQVGVKSIDPSENLRVQLGELIKIGNNSIHMYPLDIEVLKDSPIANRLGTKQGKAGRIVLSTTHPSAKEVLLFVRFALIE